jgi:NAD(P)-dependent dehydrogenase (short-subunit alcohol dehydrogenase family)
MALEIDLDGRVAIVTGGSSGIGAGVAQALAAAGASVAIVGRDAGRLGAVASRIGAEGGAAEAVVSDLRAPDSAKEIVAATVARLGRIDALVHAAGIFLLAPPEDSLSLLDEQWAINVRAPYALTVAALPYLRASKGSVIFFSSAAGRVGVAGATAYSVTKGAVEMMARGLAIDEAPNGVRVNAIAPGNIETPMNEHLLADRDYRAAKVAATPLRRLGAVDDLTATVVLLASGHAGFTTGASIAIDGGQTAQ